MRLQLTIACIGLAMLGCQSESGPGAQPATSTQTPPTATCEPIQLTAYIRSDTTDADVEDIHTAVSINTPLTSAEKGVLEQCKTGRIDWKRTGNTITEKGVPYGILEVNLSHVFFAGHKAYLQLYASVGGRLYGYCGLPRRTGILVKEMPSHCQQ
jgi:hypothetical protein